MLFLKRRVLLSCTFNYAAGIISKWYAFHLWSKRE